MVCFAQMIGQDVCVSCTYAVLLGDKSTQNRRGNAAALAGKAPDPSAGNKKPLPPGEVAAARLTERVVGADFISARARLPLSRGLSAQPTEGEKTTFRRRNFLLLFFAGHSTLKRDFFREKEHPYGSGTV